MQLLWSQKRVCEKMKLGSVHGPYILQIWLSTSKVCQAIFRSKKSGNQEFFSQKSGGYQEFFSIKSNDFMQNYK